MMRKVTLSILVIWAGTSSAWAIDGNTMALRSNGTDLGTAWQIDDNGYVGTYITLAAPTAVTLRVNAQGTAFGGIDPRMNLVVGDEVMGWGVAAGAQNYEHTFNLPAGTHFVRTEFNNDRDTSRALTVNSFEVVSGATLSNSNTSTNALNAADTYIESGRQGNATLYMPAIQPGTPVHVKLKNHAFKFGTTVPNSFTDTFLIDPDAPDADPGAAEFQQALVDNRFNSLTGENAGKWDATEGTRDVLTTKQPPATDAPYVYMDQISDYALERGWGYRQHNMIWGPNNQQPGWVNTLLTQAVSSQASADELREEISERVDYYVQDRAQRFYEIDVYNESWHTGVNTGGSNNYWDIYGAEGIAEIYKEVHDAIEAGGGQASVYMNEFSVLQNQGGDYYANWYVRHVEDVQFAGKDLYGEEVNVVTGIGYQYYINSPTGHDAARVYAVMQNMAVQGLDMHLTEWGVRDNGPVDPTEAQAAVMLDEIARLVFGMPGNTGITLWNLRNVGGVFAPVGTLYNSDWSTRDTFDAWQALMSAWDTDEMINVAGDGSIDFSGFYGDYEITVGSQTFDLSFDKGGATDFLFYNFTTLGDTDGDGDVDIDDLVNVKNNMGSTSAGFAEGDTDGDGDVDGTDLSNVKDFFGNVVTPGPPPGLTFVPEPASLGLIGVGGLMLVRRRRS